MTEDKMTECKLQTAYRHMCAGQEAACSRMNIHTCRNRRCLYSGHTENIYWLSSRL